MFTTTSITMHKVNLADGTVDVDKTFFFSTKATPIQNDSDIGELIDNLQNKIESQTDKFTNRGSNWIVVSINDVRLSLVRGGASNFIVPRHLAAKKCVIHTETKTQECFKYAVVASLHFREI